MPNRGAEFAAPEPRGLIRLAAKASGIVEQDIQKYRFRGQAGMVASAPTTSASVELCGSPACASVLFLLWYLLYPFIRDPSWRGGENERTLTVSRAFLWPIWGKGSKPCRTMEPQVRLFSGEACAYDDRQQDNQKSNKKREFSCQVGPGHIEGSKQETWPCGCRPSRPLIGRLGKTAAQKLPEPRFLTQQRRSHEHVDVSSRPRRSPRPSSGLRQEGADAQYKDAPTHGGVQGPRSEQWRKGRRSAYDTRPGGHKQGRKGADSAGQDGQQRARREGRRARPIHLFE